MTKKILSVLLACMMILSAAAFTVSAEEELVYYVEKDSIGDGMDDAPFGSIEEAILALAGEPGTIKIIGEYDISTLDHEDPAWTGMITITAGDDKAVLVTKEYSGTVFNGPATIKDIDVKPAKASHFNTKGHLFVYDPGEEVEITPPEGYKDFPEFTESNEF